VIMVDLNKRNILILTSVSVFIILYGINYYGISVPVEIPYVQLEIVSEKSEYIVGETTTQRYLLRNQMPFPIKLTFNTNMTIHYVILENTIQAGTLWERFEGTLIRIEPLNTYELQVHGLNLVEPCTLMSILNVEYLQETRTVHIIDIPEIS